MAQRDSSGRFIKGSGGKGGVRFKDTDRGFEALKARIGKAAAARLSVGVHEAEGAQSEDGETTVLDVAIFNEFGGENGNPPRRSFVADWADENADEHKELLRRSQKAVIKGTLPSTEVALERLGLRFVGDVQKRMIAGIEPENAESTIARKGSSTPLIDQGQLLSSITHQVTTGSSESSE
ncbi:MAG TPA: hypothetical protein VER11_34550 [Polyangiaceae bacterium]|nr:hypothetical protein [Polyangiaceae bacterium]